MVSLTQINEKALLVSRSSAVVLAAVHRRLSQRLGSSFVQEPREMQIRLWKLI